MQRVDHSSNIVEVKHVSFSYGKHEVLRDVNLNIHKGDYLGVVGGNGAGKTTLLRIMLGLLQPSSGSVKLFGKDLRDFKEWSRIGYVPQKATSFDANFPATAIEVVQMGLYGKKGLFRGLSEEDRERARRSLASVEMSGYENKLVGDLSGGEQQRVFIARALAGDPELLFLDEPTMSVDRTAKKEFYALLEKLNRELDLTVILITHDVEGIAYGAMHIACIDRTLFFHNSLEEYLKETRGKDTGIITHTHDNS